MRHVHRSSKGAPSNPRMTVSAMAGAQLREWRERNKLSPTAAANVLGIQQRMVYYYEDGQPIPRHVELACADYDAQLEVDRLGKILIDAQDRGFALAMLAVEKQSDKAIADAKQAINMAKHDYQLAMLKLRALQDKVEEIHHSE